MTCKRNKNGQIHKKRSSRNQINIEELQILQNIMIYQLGVGEVMCSILVSNRVIAKDIDSCTCCSYAKCVHEQGEWFGQKQVQLFTTRS